MNHNYALILANKTDTMRSVKANLSIEKRDF